MSRASQPPATAMTEKAPTRDISDETSGVLMTSPRLRASASFLADGSSVFDAASLSSAMDQPKFDNSSR